MPEDAPSWGIGHPDDLQHVLPRSPNFLRADLGQACELHITMAGAGANSQLCAVTDFADEPLSAIRVANGDFQLSLQPERRGLFHFRLLYTVDGSQWFWHCHSPVALLVGAAVPASRRMYTFLPTVSGHVGDWTAAVPVIAEMGFNLIHLLPVTEMDASQSPYSAAHLDRLDPAYLDPNDKRDGWSQLQSFAEKCEEHGVGLVVDLVLNHVGVTSQLVRQHPDWMVADAEEPDRLKRAGWSDGQTWHKWRDVVLLDYDNPLPAVREGLWKHMVDYALRWAALASQTGGLIRLDNLHSNHPAFTRHCLESIREQYDNVRFLGEFFTSPEVLAQQTQLYGLDLMLATPWEHSFVPQLRGYLEEIHQQRGQYRYIVPLTTHDSPVPAQRFGHVNATRPRYAISALCGSGHTGIVQGTECGVAQRVSFIRKPGKEPPTGDADFRAFFKAVNGILAGTSVFHQYGNIEFVDNAHHAIIAARRLASPGSDERDRLVIASFDTGNHHSLDIDLGQGSPDLRALWSDCDWSYEHGRLYVSVPPCGVAIFELIDSDSPAGRGK